MLILQAIVLAAAVAGVVAHRQTPQYQSTSQVLLIPADPAETVTPGQAPADLTTYESLQSQLATSPTVAAAVARDLHSRNPSGLVGQMSVNGGSSILYFTASDPNPRRAQALANAFAAEYLNYSKSTAVASLQRTASELQAQANTLSAQLRSSKLAANPDARRVVRAQYANVFGQFEVATINASLAKGNAQLLAHAGVASNSKTPLYESILFGAIAGLLLGLGGAFLREQLDDRVRTGADAALASGKMPILAETPQSRRGVRIIKSDGLETAMLTQLGETGRSLRTAIMFYGVRREQRRILVTSPGSGDGKTLTSALLAAAYAQAGFRTVIISADLRRPSLEALLGIDSQRTGLTDALLIPTGTARHAADDRGGVFSYVQETGMPNLSLLSSGTIAPNPSELLGSKRMEVLLDELAESFDMLILDSAPLLPVADTRTLVDNVDGIVLVVSAGRSKRDVSRARETLRPAEVKWLGIVVNRTEVPDDDNYHSQYSRSRANRIKQIEAPVARDDEVVNVSD